MNEFTVLVEKDGYIPELHEGKFPQIESCLICKKNDIVNVKLKTSKSITLYEDIGFDDNGRHVALSFYQWHHKTNGKLVTEEVLLDEDESFVDDYEIISTTIKIYTKNSYSPIISYNGKTTEISLIPYKMTNFNEKNCDSVLYKA